MLTSLIHGCCALMQCRSSVRQAREWGHPFIPGGCSFHAVSRLTNGERHREISRSASLNAGDPQHRLGTVPNVASSNVHVHTRPLLHTTRSTRALNSPSRARPQPLTPFRGHNLVPLLRFTRTPAKATAGGPSFSTATTQQIPSKAPLQMIGWWGLPAGALAAVWGQGCMRTCPCFETGSTHS